MVNNVANLRTHMEQIRRAAYELNFRKNGEEISSEDVIFLDMQFRVLEIGNTLDGTSGAPNQDSEDKSKLLQHYTQLQKVIQAKQAARDKANADKVIGDSLMDRANIRRLEIEKTIEQKALRGENFTDEENEYLEQSISGEEEA